MLAQADTLNPTASSSTAQSANSTPFWGAGTVPAPNALTALRNAERDRTDPLRLGVNEIYRDAITLAADRTGYPRATIAAVISAEAGPLRGKRLDDATNQRFFGELQRIDGPLHRLLKKIELPIDLGLLLHRVYQNPFFIGAFGMLQGHVACPYG